jgi:hypothetical protein
MSLTKASGWTHTQPYNGASNEWETPPELIAALGEFDDDPCLPGKTDGLVRKWQGRVWLNPPYGPLTKAFLRKLAKHGNGIALTFARVETRWFHSIAWRADAIFFFAGRLHFYKNGVRSKGNAGGPSCLIAYGDSNIEAIRQAGFRGVLITDVEYVVEPWK